MLKVKTCLSPLCFNKKPQATDTAIISKSIANYSTEIDFTDFVAALGKGQTFTVATNFKENKRTAANWISSQLFVADIDDLNLSLATLQERIATFDIPVSIIYESFSSTELNRKWRLIFIARKEIKNPAITLAILRKIKSHFNSDPAIIDLSRILYGTTENKIIYHELIPFDFMTLNLNDFIKLPKTTVSYQLQLPTISKKLNQYDLQKYGNILKALSYGTNSRYMSIFTATINLAKLNKFSEERIIEIIISRVKTEKRFKDYDRTLPEITQIIKNILNWKLKK